MRRSAATPPALALGLVLILAAVLPAPARESRSDRPTTRTRADRYRDLVVDGEPVSQLFGNVFVDRDSLTAAGDTAFIYRDRNEVELRGRVRVTRRASVLTCRRARYDEDTMDADFSGDVRLEDSLMVGTAMRGELRERTDLLRLFGGARLVAPEYVVWADTIVQNERGGRGEAFGRVRIVDPAAKTVVTGEHASFDREGGAAVVDRSPVLTSREQGSEELRGSARVMDFDRDGDVVMVDSVRIRQGKTLATADTAVIRESRRMILRGSPRLDDGEGGVFIGDEIEFEYGDGELRRIFLRGDARVIDDEPAALAAGYVGLPETDILEGDTITVDLEGGEPRRSFVVGNAHSIYVPGDADEEVAFNDVRGDTIVIVFDARRVDRVTVRGRMSGTYSYLRLADLPGARAAADTAAVDSLAAAFADTAAVDAFAAAAPDTGAAPVDFLAHRQQVDYSGDAVLFAIGERQIEISGGGRLVYGSMELESDLIRLDMVRRDLYASRTPLLVDREQKMAGEAMAYNFEHKSGAVTQGVTTMDDFFYVGDEVKRFSDGELKICSGRMTSCDLARPHFHFWAKKMKIRPGDKVVAKPVVMKIGEVPVFALPFYFKSLKSGRRSGILFPSFNFGWSQRTGRYVRDWGYYWATNDYTDVTLRGDYNERRELTWLLSNRYAKRYSFNGNLSYSRRTTLGSGDKVREWQFRWNHQQETLFDYYKFRSDVNMSSRSISRSDLINDVGRDVISGTQTSTVYVSRSWQDFSASLNFKREEFVNQEDDDPLTNNRLSSQAFPQLSVNFKSRSLLPPLRRGREGNFLGALLRNTYLRHSYSYNSLRETRELTDATTHDAKGNASLNIEPPRFWIFKASAGVGGSHRWTRTTTDGRSYYETTEPLPDDPDSLVTVGIYEEVRERAENTQTSLSINSSVGTTLYGIFTPHLGPLRGIRHTLGLGVSHTLSPAIAGKQVRRERFSFSLSNRFDVKYLAGGGPDSTREVKKLDGLLDWRLSTGYNPQAPDGQQWDDISSSVVLRPGRSQNLKLTLNNVIDARDLSVLSTRIVYGLSLSGEFDTGAEVAEAETEQNAALERLRSDADSTQVVEEDLWADEYDEGEDPGRDYEDEFAGFGYFSEGKEERDSTRGGRVIPWRMGSNLSYSRNHETGYVTARADANLNLTLTRNWSASYRAGYDLDAGKITHQSWRLQRDLHCWRLEFSRTVSAVDSQFGFIISLKSIPAVRLTRGKEDLVRQAGALGGGIF